MRGRALLLWLLAPACTTSMYEEVAQDVDGACIALEGHTFTSTDELTCETERCHWQLSFDIDTARTSQVTWRYAGTSEVGKVSCRGSTLTVTTPTRTLRATFDPTTLHVQWAGQTYVAQ